MCLLCQIRRSGKGKAKTRNYGGQACPGIDPYHSRPPFSPRQIWLRDRPTEQRHAQLISLSGEVDGGMVVQAVSTGSLGRRFRLASLWQEAWHQKGRASLVCAVSQSYREHWLFKFGGREIRPERVYRLELGNVSLPQLWIGANRQKRRVHWDARDARRQEVLALLFSAVGKGKAQTAPNHQPEQRSKEHGCRQASIGGSLSNQASPFLSDDLRKTIKPQTGKPQNHNLWSRRQSRP